MNKPSQIRIGSNWRRKERKKEKLKVGVDRCCVHYHVHNHRLVKKVAVLEEDQVTLDDRNLPKQREDNGNQKATQLLQEVHRSNQTRELEEAMKHPTLVVAQDWRLEVVVDVGILLVLFGHLLVAVGSIRQDHILHEDA